ncbi:hypothetical protein J4E96_19450 [Pengzhenrongella sicca]|uniref:Uncharacterized protein n=1 Tax=Pengzhenrongella sicca TaxID=2819238 RepID=A0A8A4ZEG4_9MICO|nr:hypothetical protein [Pengzhenrongella sicca]QTE29409.1 hypothetical protein J4E96_19450 [Pengzhenrongella sicca]
MRSRTLTLDALTHTLALPPVPQVAVETAGQVAALFVVPLALSKVRTTSAASPVAPTIVVHGLATWTTSRYVPALTTTTAGSSAVPVGAFARPAARVVASPDPSAATTTSATRGAGAGVTVTGPVGAEACPAASTATTA